jgi:hypothetical protein
VEKYNFGSASRRASDVSTRVLKCEDEKSLLHSAASVSGCAWGRYVPHTRAHASHSAVFGWLRVPRVVCSSLLFFSDSAAASSRSAHLHRRRDIDTMRLEVVCENGEPIRDSLYSVKRVEITLLTRREPIGSRRFLFPTSSPQ